MPLKILAVLGTRPEVVKMAPVISALRALKGVDLRVCATAQHREMMDSALRLFGIRPDDDLDLMEKDQGLSRLASRAILGLDRVLKKRRPDRLLVQGDTTTALAAALAARHLGIPVAHVEAGLRTGDLSAPWPEEGNRRAITALSDLHFAPTPKARENLIRTGVPLSRVFVTGNTAVDALKQMARRLSSDGRLARRMERRFPFLRGERNVILATGHRRESLDGGLERIFRALKNLSARPGVLVLLPLHPHPRIKALAGRILSRSPRVRLLPHQDYASFVYLMTRARLIVTDSGGIQEEAAALGRPALVVREKTERTEGLRTGAAILAGTAPEKIAAAAARILDDPGLYRRMSGARNPYGDGRAGPRIARLLLLHGAP